MRYSGILIKSAGESSGLPRTGKNFGALAALFGVLLLGGCGITRNDGGIFCRTGCDDPNKMRDFFCDCVDRPSETPPPVTSAPNNHLSASCMCSLGGGNYSAWFFDGLQSKDWALNRTMTITASSCAYINVCPRVTTPTGGYQYNVVTGTLRMRVQQSGWDARFGGNYLVGPDQQQQGRLSDGNFDVAQVVEVPTEEASTPHEMLSQAAADVAPDRGRDAAEQDLAFAPGDQFQLAQAGSPGSAPLRCENLCDPSQPSPYCAFVTLGPPQRSAFSTLFSLANDQGAALYPADFVRNIFNVAQDPCGRTDTEISAGKITNRGTGACRISTRSTAAGIAVNVDLSVPETLSGDVARVANGQVVTFSDPATSMALEFSESSFNADFGGTLTRLVARRDRLFWQTERGCISVGLQ